VAIVSLITPTGANIAFPTKSATQSIVLVAASNRMVLVAVCGREQKTPIPPETIPVVTYGGVAMELMVRDNLAQSFITGGAASRVSVFWFCLREAQLPPNGANDLIVDWSALSGTNWGFRYELYELANLDQSPKVRGFTRLATTLGTQPLPGTFPGGGVSDALLIAGSNANSAGSFQITIDGVGITEDFDATYGNGRACAGTDLVAGAVAPISFSLAFTNGNNVATVALRLAEFFAPTSGAACVMTDAARDAAVVAESTPQTVSVIAS
jgi:hypothetical protein